MAKRASRRKRSRGGVMVRSAEFIGWALGGLEREIAETRERLAALTAQAARLRARVRSTQRGPAAAPSFDEPAVRGRRRRRMSAQARKRLSEATRKRWAERKKKGLNKL